MFFRFFYKTEAGYVFKMFVTSRPISASRSYKLGSFKKKTCILLVNPNANVFKTKFFNAFLPSFYDFALTL